MAFLEIIKPEDKRGQRFDITGNQLSIGRVADNDCVIEDVAASSHHCVVIHDGQMYSLRDKGSTNGTLVNGAGITSIRLNAKDIITVGSVEMLFDGDDIEPDVSRDLRSPPSGNGVNTVILDSPANSGVTPAAFGTRKSNKGRWIAVGILVGIGVAVLAYFFVRELYGPS